MTQETAVILFAHGSRDERWRAPFEAVRAEVERRHGGRVVLAFLELMSPSLAEAAALLAAEGVTRAVIVPLFLGVGRHLREDLPAMAETAARETGLTLVAAKSAGESPAIVEALASYAIGAAAADA